MKVHVDSAGITIAHESEEELALLNHLNTRGLPPNCYRFGEVSPAGGLRIEVDDGVLGEPAANANPLRPLEAGEEPVLDAATVERMWPKPWRVGLRTTFHTFPLDSPRLQVVLKLADAGLLPPQASEVIEMLGPDLIQVRQGPRVYLSTPGAGCFSPLLDLSDRAVELLAAAGTDVRNE